MSDVIVTDVLIVGSGVAGALVAHELALSGARVTILEAGQSVVRYDAVQKFWNSAIKVPESPYPRKAEAMFPVSNEPADWYRQSGPVNFKSTYLKVVGGTTWHWLGTCLRLLPSDFKLKSLYSRGVDWPITYDELEPFYGKAEHAMGVSGDSTEDLGSPRSAPFPMPPISPTYLDKKLTNALDGTKYKVRSTPQARNSVFRDARSACCGSASCVPICPVQAKYDATVHILKAVAAGAKLLEKSNAVKLNIESDGKVSEVQFRRWDRSEGVVRAKIVVLACNAVEIPRLLLASRSERTPNGVANRSDQVGRNLMDHPAQLSWALAAEPVYPYRGPISTSGIENLRDGAFRRDRGAYRIEIGNDGWSWPKAAPMTTAQDFIDKGLRGKALDQAIADHTSRQFRLVSLIEQDPEQENRITLDGTDVDFYGVPLPRITYRISEYVQNGLAVARQDHEEIMKRWGATEVTHADEFFGAGHIMGTTRMGTDPKTSVVDQNLQCHDHRNMFILGAGVFPTTGTANPTLTIAALSLRAAQQIRRVLVA